MSDEEIQSKLSFELTAFDLETIEVNERSGKSVLDKLVDLRKLHRLEQGCTKWWCNSPAFVELLDALDEDTFPILLILAVNRIATTELTSQA